MWDEEKEIALQKHCSILGMMTILKPWYLLITHSKQLVE